MDENKLASQVLDCCFKIHRQLGPGLFESIYERVLVHELTRAGLSFSRQIEVPIRYDDLILEAGFRADIVVEQKLVLELKSVEMLLPVHKKQLLSYLRLMDLRLGLLINFNTDLLREGIIRVANRMSLDLQS